MVLVSYNFHEFLRARVPQELTDARPKGVLRFFTLPPEEGGEPSFAEVVEKTTLAKLLDRGTVYAADGAAANDVVQAATSEDFSRMLATYVATIRKLSRTEDLPSFRREVAYFCHCGCGRLEARNEYDFVEVMFVPNEVRVVFEDSFGFSENNQFSLGPFPWDQVCWKPGSLRVEGAFAAKLDDGQWTVVLEEGFSSKFPELEEELSPYRLLTSLKVEPV